MKKKNKILLVMAILSFLITFGEAYLFYENFREFGLIHLLLSIQNGIKAFLFSPDIPAAEVLARLQENPGSLQLCFGYAYVISTFLAPLCTASALLLVIKLMFAEAFCPTVKRMRAGFSSLATMSMWKLF